MLGGPLEALLELLGEHARVQPQVVAIGPQEASDVDRPGEQVPLLVLQCPEVFGPDLGRRLNLGDIHPSADSGLPQGRANVVHRCKATGGGAAPKGELAGRFCPERLAPRSSRDYGSSGRSGRAPTGDAAPPSASARCERIRGTSASPINT